MDANAALVAPVFVLVVMVLGFEAVVCDVDACVVEADGFEGFGCEEEGAEVAFPWETAE